MTDNAITEQQKGLAAGVFCFVFWGFVPVYFKFLQQVPAIEIIAHRIIWAALCLLLFLMLRERGEFFRALKIKPHQMLALLLSGSLIIGNWLIFVWAVNSGQILATSLGYFITPLVSVLLGLLILKERLNRTQMIALLLAAVSTFFLGIYLGQPPWIALALAMTFGLYGLVRKQLDVRPLIGLFWETALWALPALIYLVYWIQVNQSTTEQVGYSSIVQTLLVLSGIMTIIPLIAFNYAAKRLALSLVGFLQYIGPTISFLIAVLFYGEVFTLGHKVAFTGIWLAILIISWRPLMRLLKPKPKLRNH